MGVEIIAEIGVNHNGDLTTACELARQARACGCDTVKTQLFNSGRSYGDARVSRLELSLREIDHLRRYCVGQGLKFLCTPDDQQDADLLLGISVERFKIGSSNVTNLPLIRHVAGYGLSTLLSTGACTWADVCAAVLAYTQGAGGRHKLTLMHCVSVYPAPFAAMNLNMLRVYRRQFRCALGLSDHSIGWEAAAMSVALGISVIEKHFTLDDTQPGPDHAISLDSPMMYAFVRHIREAENAMGSGDKYVLDCEQENRAEYLKFVARQTGAAHADGSTVS